LESFLWSASSSFIRLHDFPGREPALVLIHGLGASAAQAFVDTCRRPPLRDRRCIAPDLLGFGHSDHPETFSYSVEDHAASVAALVDALGLDTIQLVGHSMGGAVAIALAASRPDLVARLILVEAHLDPTPGSVSGPVVASPESDFVRSGHADLVRLFASQGLASYAGAFQVADPVGIHRSAVSLLAPRRPSFREMLVALPTPRTFFFGGRNASDPDVEWLPAHGIPIRMIPDAGHDLMSDQPDAFADELSRLLSS
jgi:pimeloyl-ACP methyl ester carboxylesterase